MAATAQKDDERKEEKDGQLYMWQGYHGDVEVVKFSTLSNTPIKKVALGTNHSIFLSREGQVYSCGSNSHGQLGVDVGADAYDPILINSLSGITVKDIASGNNHCAAVTNNGKVYCWGDSRKAQCAIKKDRVDKPEQVSINKEIQDHCQHGIPLETEEVLVTDVSCGSEHTVSLSSCGEVWVWGSGVGMGLEIECTVQPILLQQKLSGKRVLSISCGWYHTLAVVEKSILDDSYSVVKKRRSKALETLTHKNSPSTCAKCNAEIYSYTETLDTCIITEEHLCESVESLKSKCGSFSDSHNLNVVSEIKTEVKSNCDSILGSAKNSSQSIPLKSISSNPADQSDSVVTDHVTSDDNNEEIWVKQDTASETDVVCVSNHPRADSPESQGMHKCPGSNKLTMGLSKSSSFINEKEARKYLAEQYEEKVEDAQTEKEPKKSEDSSTLGNILTSVQTYPADVMQQITSVPYHVTAMTSKAISNITDKFGFGTEGEKRDSISGSSGHGSQLFLAEFDTSEEDLHMQAHNKVSEANTSTVAEETSFISENVPLLDTTFDTSVVSPSKSPPTPEKNKVSLRTIQAKQENLEKLSSNSDKVQSPQDVADGNIILETEVWAWGKNNKGQLGQGDEIDREQPVIVKILNGAKIVKVCCGAYHSLAMSADCKVYSWGLGTSGQLARSDYTPRPTQIQLMDRCYVWDIAAGEKFSVFLMDRDGFQPEIHYVGKHPCRDLYVPVYKTNRLTCLNFLKQAGWVRAISAGEDNSACLSCWSFSGFTATLFEVAATERRFYSYLNQVVSQIIHPLKNSSFFTTLDVYPYKSCTQNLLSSLENITNMVGEISMDLTSRIRVTDNFLEAIFFRKYEELVAEFKRYTVSYADILAIGGIDYLCKMGSSVFAKLEKDLTGLLHGTTCEKMSVKEKLQTLFNRPFSHLKEYSRLTEKLSCNYESDTSEYRMLNRIMLEWESLRRTAVADHKVANDTKEFWDTLNFPKLIDAVKIPSRRIIRNSRKHPLTLQGAGRMATNDFFLFNDLFVHAQYSAYQSYPLDTLWTETPMDDKLRNAVTVIMPEERLTMIALDGTSKTEWLLAFNSTINKVLSRQKSVGRRGSSDRLTPPDVRFSSHGFIKHGVFRGGTYSGYWMTGKLHGFGEMKWADGRRYIGNFKEGCQHGHGRLIIKQDDGKDRIQEGYWKEGLLHGLAKVKYSNGDSYEGYFKDGQRHGHGVYRHGQHNSAAASIYIGEWVSDKKQGYGVMDDIMKGEKYMGMWSDDMRQGGGIVVTLDGMYFEGKFSHDKLTGYGLMLTDDNSCYEGEFAGITQLQGKGKLIMPYGDTIEGWFSGSWNEGLKINGTFNKCLNRTVTKKPSHFNVSSIFGTMAVAAASRWEGMFQQCVSIFRAKGQDYMDTKKAWENVAVMLFKGKKNIIEMHRNPNSKLKRLLSLAEDLETIPPYNQGKLTVEYYIQIKLYLQKAFDLPLHPLGKLMESLVDVFRAAYIGVGAHPRLLDHAVKEISSFVTRLYKCVRILFPDLPENGGPLQIESDTSLTEHTEEKSTVEVLSCGTLLHPFLLPKIYPPLFDLYALYNDKEDEKYWERVKKLNKQGDIGLMAYLGIDEKFWLLDDVFQDKTKSLSSLRDHCYNRSIETLQHISTAFSPKEKLEVIHKTFCNVTKTVQDSIGDVQIWCMDELFPIFQYVVIRSQIRHLGAEIHLIQDLMDPHLENGELGIMFTTLHACYFQIQNEKIPSH